MHFRIQNCFVYAVKICVCIYYIYHKSNSYCIPIALDKRDFCMRSTFPNLTGCYVYLHWLCNWLKAAHICVTGRRCTLHTLIKTNTIDVLLWRLPATHHPIWMVFSKTSITLQMIMIAISVTLNRAKKCYTESAEAQEQFR